MNIRDLAAKAVVVNEEQIKLNKARNRANHVKAAQMLVKSLLGINDANVVLAHTWDPVEHDTGEQWGHGAVIQLDDIYVAVGHEWETTHDMWNGRKSVPGRQCLYISTEKGLRTLTNANIYSLADLGRDIAKSDEQAKTNAYYKRLAEERKAKEEAKKAAGQMRAYIGILELIGLAQDLRGEDPGDNPEYDRALLELVSDAAGMREEDRHVMAALIGIRNQ